MKEKKAGRGDWESVQAKKVSLYGLRSESAQGADASTK